VRIVRYIDEDRNVAPLIADSLVRLQYRGYDSAGVAVNDGKKLIWRKACENGNEVEDIEDVAKRLDFYSISCQSNTSANR
jgi:glucosamine--fructose-6-phosphate aminotransferase (isomerizing)